MSPATDKTWKEIAARYGRMARSGFPGLAEFVALLPSIQEAAERHGVNVFPLEDQLVLSRTPSYPEVLELTHVVLRPTESGEILIEYWGNDFDRLAAFNCPHNESMPQIIDALESHLGVEHA